MARIGIFGGTFDPIHLGHLMCAEQARDACALDTVLFVPVSIPAATKIDPVLAAEDRMRMCKLAIADNPSFDVCDVDIVRGGITYTADTLSDIRALYSGEDELFCMGDNREVSLDSRSPQVGNVDEDDVVGKAVVRLFPFNQITRL